MAIVYHIWRTMKKSRNGDKLGPVELIVWPEQADQGDQREQDDQGEVFFIIFGMSKSSGFQKYCICCVFRHFVSVFVFVIFFVIVFVCICVVLWFLNSFHHKPSEYMVIGVCEAYEQK